MNAMYKILVVDDEQNIVSLLRDYFEMEGYEVWTAKNGVEALEKALQGPDIILLDVNMPGVDGLEVCRAVRDYVTCPILFLTAKVEDSGKISGFAAGGDDYILKPFSMEELRARVAAHIRREHRVRSEANVRFFGGLRIDYTACTVSAEDEVLELTRKEYQIVELLSLNCGQVFDKEKIYEKIWGYDAEGDSQVIAEHIRRLRAKLAKVGGEAHLETVWGMGYRWVK